MNGDPVPRPARGGSHRQRRTSHPAGGPYPLSSRAVAARGWLGALRRPSPQRTVVLQAAKGGLAAGLAWQAALVLHIPSPLYAPLAALLTVYATVLRSVVAGAQRILGVLVGILLAYGLSQLLPLSAITVALVVGLALAVSQWQRLGDQASQVPVTALLLLLLGRSDPPRYALVRVLETLLGAAIGVAVNVVIAPPVHTRSAAGALRGAADSVGELLGDTVDALGGRWPPEHRDWWVVRGRELATQLAAARQAVAQARESRRLNPRRTVRRGGTGDLERILDQLEHVTVLTRAIVRVLHDAADEDHPAALDEAFRRPFARLLLYAQQRINQLPAGEPDHQHPGTRETQAGPQEWTDADCRRELDRMAREVTSSPGLDPGDVVVQTSLVGQLDRLLAQLMT